jgi:S-adenosylmethionine hydrolase
VSGVDLVGPDNGLLSFAWDALGGVDAVVEVRSDAVVLAPVSRTFHGRDVFAPAAAHVARGMALTDLGPAVDPGMLRTLEVPGPMVAVGAVGARVMSVDGFGNVQLNARADDLEAAGIGDTMSVGGRVVPRVGIFSDVPPGAVAALLDSQGQLALVVNSGSAAETLGLVVGRAVVIEAVETTAPLGPEAPEPGGLDPTA